VKVSSTTDVLGLKIEDILKRRLPSIAAEKKLGIAQNMQGS